MKKIINTTLVAVAIAVAMTSTVNAKQMKRTNQPTTRRMPEVKRETSASELNTVAQEVVVNPSVETVEAVKETLTSLTGNEAEIARLAAQINELETTITAQTKAIADMPRAGMISFFDRRTNEEKTARQVAEDKLKDTKADLKSANIDKAKLVQTKEEKSLYLRAKEAISSLRAVDVVAAGAAAGTIAFFIDAFAFGGAGSKYVMEKGAAVLKYAKDKGASAVKYGQETGTSMYRRVRGTTPVTRAMQSDYNLPQYQ